MTRLSLEHGHEVFLQNCAKKVRVQLQPGYAIASGSRLTNASRSFWTKAQTWNSATSMSGGIGSVVIGGVWLATFGCRWLEYHVRRRRDWTVTVSSYEVTETDLPGRSDPVEGTFVRTMAFSRHPNFESALLQATMKAEALTQQGFQSVRYPAWGPRTSLR